jgi:hypothetical protein
VVKVLGLNTLSNFPFHPLLRNNSSSNNNNRGAC